MYSGEFLPDSQVHYFPLEDNPVGGRHNLVEKKVLRLLRNLTINSQGHILFIYFIYLDHIGKKRMAQGCYLHC